MAGWLGFLEAYICLSSRETQWASRRAWVVWACWDLCHPDPAFPHAASPEGQVVLGPDWQRTCGQLDVGKAGRVVLSRTPSGPPAASPEGQVGLGPDWQRTRGQLDVGKARGFSPAEPQGSP